MPLRNYAAFLRRHLWLILGLALVVAIVAGVAEAGKANYHRSNGAVLLKVTDPRRVPDYDFDQYYALQATEIYSQNVLNWLNSDDFTDQIKQNSGSADGTIHGKKRGGTVELTGTAADKARAEALVRSAGELIGERARLLARGSTRSSFTTIPTAIRTQEVSPNPLRAGGIALVAGLIFGLAAALIREAFRPAPRRRR